MFIGEGPHKGRPAPNMQPVRLVETIRSLRAHAEEGRHLWHPCPNCAPGLGVYWQAFPTMPCDIDMGYAGMLLRMAERMGINIHDPGAVLDCEAQPFIEAHHRRGW